MSTTGTIAMILGLLLLAHDRLGDAAGRDRMLAALSDMKGDPEAERTVAEHHARKGDFEEAIGLLQQAVEHSGESSAARYHLALADTLYRAGQFAEAVEEYDQVLIPISCSSECIRHLAALLLAGRFNRALRVAQSVRAGGPAVPDFSEIEALIRNV
jgi:tetratricopeptide (TPR) repeat protein